MDWQEVQWEAVLELASHMPAGTLIVYKWCRCDGIFTGKAVRVSPSENAQIYTTFTERNGVELQIGYRFRRKTLRKILPHPRILAG